MFNTRIQSVLSKDSDFQASLKDALLLLLCHHLDYNSLDGSQRIPSEFT